MDLAGIPLAGTPQFGTFVLSAASQDEFPPTTIRGVATRRGIAVRASTPGLRLRFPTPAGSTNAELQSPRNPSEAQA